MPDFFHYEEFSFLHENAEEFGISWNGLPAPERVFAPLADGRTLAMIRWGEGQPTHVFLHGGGQNAHTWDTVCLALGPDLDAVAIDLPGHGHSDAALEGPANPQANAADVAQVIAAVAPAGVHLVGMSLGGLTSLAIADQFPALVKSVLLVDVTPGVTTKQSQSIIDFINGPPTFPDLDAILARAVQFNPERSVASLRRGILHNAVQLADGSWKWRYARLQVGGNQVMDYSKLWDAVTRLQAPLCLARGLKPQSVVVDQDVGELMQRCPGARVVSFPEAGHSVQGDNPLELAQLILEFGGQ